MKSRVFIYLALSVLILGCASQLKQIKNPNTPFERPGFSILPPPGDHWFYADGEQAGVYNIYFGKKFDSKTHTLVALVSENHGLTKFNSPEEFLNFVKKTMDLQTDPRRFKVQKDELDLDNKFGPYCVRYYTITEDHNPVYKGNAEYLNLENYEYIFVHPNIENVMISVLYSERGNPDEIDPNFDKTAERFFDGLKLKQAD